MTKLLATLQHGKRAVQEGALTAMASVADCAKVRLESLQLLSPLQHGRRAMHEGALKAMASVADCAEARIRRFHRKLRLLLCSMADELCMPCYGHGRCRDCAMLRSPCTDDFAAAACTIQHALQLRAGCSRCCRPTSAEVL